jgi:RNA polymerase sigma-70 factor (ECF subfamily)
MPHPVDASVKLEGSAERGPAGPERVITRVEIPAPGYGVTDILRYQSDLLQRASVLTRRDMSRARDLVQDTFERALRNLHRLMPNSNVRAWLYTILAHRYQDLCRADATRAALPLDDDQPGPPPPESELPPRWTSITPADLKAALAELTPDLRATFEYREFGRLSYDEIGRITRVPVATVGTRLCRARARLKEILTARLNLEDSE